ncbi:glycosyl hydrolase family 18 protein [Paenibacillus sp. 2RAB27]|uniref:CBM96 family carbohydrate-binding protein n=1 Tax=Paenibacillus sp. 2RAB27 TaxID=3232991 RepID=UPI003F9E8E71
MLKRLMSVLIVLCLLMSGGNLVFAAAPANFKIVGYVFSNADVNAVPYAKVTHINYSFARPTATGGFNIDNPSNFAALVTKSRAEGKKIFLAIGGGQQVSTDNFATFAANPQYRTDFVNNCMDVINQYSLDGIDMDWEFPAGGDNPANFALLISELSTAIHNAGKLLTAAVNAYGPNADVILSSTFSSFDWINIMAYDKGSDPATKANYQVATTALNYWAGRGLPAKKTVLGVPFYSTPNFISYNDLVQNDSEAPNKDSSTYNGVVEYYNGKAQIISKTNLALSKGLGGMMVWESMKDTNDASTSLFSAIKDAMAAYSGGGIEKSTSYSVTADTYVRGGIYASQNFGTSTTIEVKDASEDFVREGYLQFTAANLTNVTSAKIRIYGYADSTATVSVYGVNNNSWTETGINFTNKPTASTLQSTQTIGSSAQYYEFDVTNFVKSKVISGDSLFSFTITGPHITQNVGVHFNSKENSANKPQLVITAPVPATGVSLNKNTLALTAGSKETLTATVEPEDATKSAVTWTSNNESVATVGTDGLVTAVAVGTAVITATTADGGYTATATVTVTEAPVVQLPNAPTGLTAQSAGKTSIKLNWSPSDDTVSYAVYRSTSQTGTYAKVNSDLVVETTYTDTGLESGTSYYYKVTAINVAGQSEASAFAFATTDGSGTSGGNGNSSSSSSNTDRNGSAQVTAGTITVKATAGANGAMQATLKADTMKQAVAAASDGKLNIEVQSDVSAPGKTEVTLPLQEALASGSISHIALSASGATLVFSAKPSDGLLPPGTKEMSVIIEKVDTSKLPASVQRQVGSHPVFDFDLMVDGTKISRFDSAGSVTVSVKYNLQQGENGHEIVVYYIGDDGKLVIVKNAEYDAASGTVSFAPQHFSHYAVGYNHVILGDLYQASWARTMIESLAARQIVAGTDSGLFEPNRSVTRAEFLKLLLAALELNDERATSSFKDIRTDAWYYQVVALAEKLGITKGKEDGTFGANETITREDMAVMLSRAAAAAGVKLGGTGTSALFKDSAVIAAYAANAVNEMKLAGLIDGFTDGTFGPKQQTSRAQAAAVIYKLLDRNK